MNDLKTTVKIIIRTLCILPYANVQALGKFDGLFIGVSGGGDFGTVKAQTAGAGTVLADVRASNTTDIASSGMTGGVFAGYGQTLQGLYIGIEGAGEIHSSQGKSANNSLVGNNVTTITSIKKRNTFSLGIRLGKQISDKEFLYVKGGVAWPNYRLNSSVSIRGVIQTAASQTHNKRISQLVAGVGAEHLIRVIGFQQKLIGGIEYQHIFAKKVKINLNSNTFNGQTSFTPSSNVIKAKLTLKF